MFGKGVQYTTSVFENLKNIMHVILIMIRNVHLIKFFMSWFNAIYQLFLYCPSTVFTSVLYTCWPELRVCPSLRMTHMESMKIPLTESLIARLNSNFNYNFNWVKNSINFGGFQPPPHQPTRIKIKLQFLHHF